MLASSTCPLSCLIRHGSTLGELMRINSKIRQGSIHPASDNFHEKVGVVVDQFLQELNQAHASYVNESMVKVITKIEELVQEFTKVDNVHAEFYDNLTNKLKPFKDRWEQQSSAVAFSSVDQDASPSEHQSISDANLVEESSFEARYQKLTEKEKLCLVYFSLFPDEVGIKKRDLFYCWLGMELIEPGTDGGKAVGEQVLAKLVEEGLVVRFSTSSLCSRYKTNASFCSEIKQANSMFLKAAKEQSFSIITQQVDDESERKEPDQNVEALLLHSNGERLDKKTLDWLSKMRNARVVHLGSWSDLSNMNATFVEDIEVLKVLKNLVNVRFLSLGGVSGIVSLPDSVCKLENLEILDVRACNNLESLPAGIGSLQKLRQLDMSECYLLDQIPKAIATLSNLVVLKGFVIKQEHDSKNNGSYGRSQKAKTCSCALSNLVELKQLRKLSIRTKRMNFPTREDLETLCEMQLTKLGIAWVGNSSDAQTDTDLDKFPKTVNKLELETAPRRAASRLLELISMQRGNNLEKLYIKGGGLKELVPMKHHLAHVKRVRLRYLSKLDVEWHQFKESFPSLVHLQIFQCPNLVFFPSDEEGTWEN